MKRKLLLGLLFVALLTGLPIYLQAAEPPEVGQSFPDFQLPIPKENTDKGYLGLTGGFFPFGGGSFKVPQLKAQVVIFQIFSMYCPHCQKDAPNVNRLYTLIEHNPKSRGKVKLIGAGAGNNPYEVGVFKKKYQVPFPLFQDADFLVHKKMGEVRTPYFVVIRIFNDGTNRVVYSKLGSFDDPVRFLDTVITMSGI
jgi:peroxiredoxin